MPHRPHSHPRDPRGYLPEHNPRHPRADGDLSKEFVPVLHRISVTCWTTNCPNDGQTWEMEAWSNADQDWRVYCALCDGKLTPTVIGRHRDQPERT